MLTVGDKGGSVRAVLRPGRLCTDGWVLYWRSAHGPYTFGTCLYVRWGTGQETVGGQRETHGTVWCHGRTECTIGKAGACGIIQIRLPGLVLIFRFQFNISSVFETTIYIFFFFVETLWYYKCKHYFVLLVLGIWCQITYMFWQHCEENFALYNYVIICFLD